MMNDYDIAEIYKQMELHLISSMKRNLGRHLKDEAASGFEWKMWQAEKLKELKRYQRENKDIINSYTNGLDKDIADILKDEFKQGAKSELNRYNKLFDKNLSDSFFKLNDRKANALIKVVNNDLNKGNRACLRMINDQYRKTIYKAATFANTGVMTTKQAVDMATKDFLNAGFNVIEYKNGRRVNISSYSQMAVRTASQRAMLMGEGEFRKELGESLIIVSRHGTSCDICKPFEGKVFVDDVYSNGKPDKKHELLSDAMEKGLFHPNCRHGVNTYYDLDGIDEAAPIDKVPVDNDNPEASKIDVAMQREQRKIAGCQSPKNIKAAKQKLKELEAEKEEVVFSNVTDNIKNIDERLHTETINRINELSNKYKSMPDFFKTKGTSIQEEMMGPFTYAGVKYDYEVKEVNFAVNKFIYRDYDKLLDKTIESVTKGFFMPCDEKNYTIYTITHEYGHAIECSLIDQYNIDHADELQKVKAQIEKALKSKDPKYAQERASKLARDYTTRIANGISDEIVEIAMKNNPNFVLADNLSKYGKTNAYEFFAEAFANANCGKPNELGKAMQEYLKMKGV